MSSHFRKRENLVPDRHRIFPPGRSWCRTHPACSRRVAPGRIPDHLAPWLGSSLVAAHPHTNTSVPRALIQPEQRLASHVRRQFSFVPLPTYPPPSLSFTFNNLLPAQLSDSRRTNATRYLTAIYQRQDCLPCDSWAPTPPLSERSCFSRSGTRRLSPRLF